MSTSHFLFTLDGLTALQNLYLDSCSGLTSRPDVLDSEGLAGEPWEGSAGTAGAVGVGATRGERKGGRGDGWRGARQHGCKLQLK